MNGQDPIKFTVLNRYRNLVISEMCFVQNNISINHMNWPAFDRSYVFVKFCFDFITVMFGKRQHDYKLSNLSEILSSIFYLRWNLS